MTMRRAILLGGVAALGACSLDPHYAQPRPAIAPRFPTEGAYAAASGEAPPPVVRYTDVFRDPKLQAIIAQALANNQNIRIALANIEVARGQYRVQRALQLPEIDANARVNESQSSTTVSAQTGAPSGTGTTGGSTARRPPITTYNVNLGLAAFELDLFGRLRSLSRAALQDYLATEAAARTTRLTLVAEVASAYLTLAADRSLLAIAADTEASALKSVQLTDARRAGGVAPRSDVRQAETVLAQARSDRAAQETLVAQDRNALELLAGGPVADAMLPASIESVDAMLAELPAGLDSRILLRRPDVVQAEYSLRAANARIGAARAAFFPTISLTAAAGLASTGLSALFTGGAFNWSVTPAANLPIFDGGANRGNIAAARARFDAALGQYQLTVQTAFRDVSDALARRGTIEAQVAAQVELETAARDSNELEVARYREGIDPYLNTLDTQRTLYSARRALATVRLTRADNLVTLYRVLGGDQLSDITPATGRNS